MADGTPGQNHLAPQNGQPQMNADVGALITLAGAGAGTTNSVDQVNNGSRGVSVIINISAKSGTISDVVNIQTKDVGSGIYTTLLSSAALSAVATTRLVVYPTITAVTNSIAQDCLGEVWRVQIVCGTGSTPSTTCTIGACLLA
jgi:hypothetical protein